MTESVPNQYPFPRTRWQAGAAHLGVSAVVGAILFALIRFVWYPDGLFAISGGSELALLIIGCDVVIGPLLTTLVFRRGKRTLRFDLAVIFLLQLAAFVYGTWVLYTSRPAFLVAAVDRIYAIGYNQIDPVDLAAAPEGVSANVFSPAYYGVTLPTDPKLIDSLLFNEFAQGKDLQMLPRFFRPYEESRATLLRDQKKDAAGQAYVPVIARNGVGLAYLDEAGNVKRIQAGDPWEAEAKPAK